MVIANPIYDVVFKRLMENERVAKFFVGTLLDEDIEKIEVKPQEFTYIKDIDQDDVLVQKYIKEKIRERLSINVLRLDFIATVKTETGEYKKILIEIQKAKNQVDLMRFRNYLAEQYKKADEISGEKSVLPITTIYILGFTIPEIESPCIKVERNYRDLIDKKILETKSDFVEKLTHDSYIVQVNRITSRFQTKLDKLLSIFEQSNFLDEKQIIKEFTHKIDNEDLQVTADILHHAGTDPQERKQIEIEQEAWRSINALFEDKERKYQKALETIEEKEKALFEKDKALSDKENVIDQMAKELEALKRKLGN